MIDNEQKIPTQANQYVGPTAKRMQRLEYIVFNRNWSKKKMHKCGISTKEARALLSASFQGLNEERIRALETN